ncbi:DUF4160 domain-containing protein [Leptolyngbya sp. CCNP1308]|uniref:DUF4160 domain-containing protein n=1 Tax=Leptolyngbya sp. CCNP1308 TaxID=3110255 RepID=UPI002B20E84E|nr:DUF4160 domain-containing protein [Leptolyngbya sp. CCNP1308]MEA5450298.1 DUF4160 domain-containing protein [Leptolyngbya sp. CCNP1308]
MPTVLRKDGFDFRIYFDDHVPAHVHAFKGSGEVKISLGDLLTKPTVLVAYNMSNKEAKLALAIVLKHQTELLKRWVEMHG